LIGPRTGSKTSELSIPTPMGPNVAGLDCTVSRVESMPPSTSVELVNGGAFLHWFEELDGSAEVTLRTARGAPAIMRTGGLHYVAGWPEAASYVDILEGLAAQANIPTQRLPSGLRLRETQTHRFWINYAPDEVSYDGKTIAAADVLWETRD
jgi:beta-galactosidase